MFVKCLSIYQISFLVCLSCCHVSFLSMSVFPPTPGSGLLSLSLSLARPRPNLSCRPLWPGESSGGEETTSCQIPRGPFSGTGGTRLILKGTVQNFLTLAKSALGFHEMKKNLTKLLFEDRRDLLTFFLNILFIHLFLGVETIRWFSLLSP